MTVLTTLKTALLLLAWYAGHCELWTAALNRIYANPWRRERLSRWRRWHDWALPLFPPLLVGWVGLWRPGLLLGGSWAELDWPWLIYLVLCGCGTLSLIVHTFWRHVRPVPAAVIERDTRHFDLAEELGGRPIGEGRHRRMARLWFNESFELEIVSRTIRLPSLPPGCDGLSIIQFSDLHLTGTVDRPWFERVVELAAETSPDLVVCTGDLLDDMSLADWLPATLGRIDAPLGRFFILGNHDWHLRPEEIRRTMVEEAGWTDVAGRCERIEHGGGVLEIGGTELPWLGQHPPFPVAAGDQAGDQAGFRLLLSHTPDNVDWARAHDVDLVLAGHNHGGQVCLPLIGPVYAPSRYGCRYSAGEFQTGRTLLIVSRGLSGRQPLRWLCRPELTRLVLRAG